MAGYYKVDSRRLSLREYWNLLPSWKILIPWVAKWFHCRMSLGSGFYKFDSIRELEIAESELPPDVRAELQPLMDEALQMGFYSPRYYRYETLRRDVSTWFISYLHPSGDFSLRFNYTVVKNAQPPVRSRLISLLSVLSDGTFLVSGDQKPKFRVAPGIIVNRRIGATLAQLTESHQQQLDLRRLRTPPEPIQTLEVLNRITDTYETYVHDYGVARGLYVEMPAEEVEKDRSPAQTAEVLTQDGIPHAEVIVELNQLQNRKAGWGNGLVVLLISLLFFFGAGAKQWSWEYLFILIPVLFFHELGHYAAMRVFKYRNLRMFFIPFFGAAVTGQHFNVPGWKKVVVSLMGPLPGIVLGAILGSVGLILNQPLLIRIALVTVFLNGFNLLPVLPLDGGWVLHALIFSRHRWLDLASRILAGLALVAAASFLDSKIFLFLGIAMLAGIPAANRIARITRELRQSTITPVSDDSQTVPTGTAVAIVEQLKKDPPKPCNTKILAQQTLTIFENLNARPPGWMATAGLLFVYATTVGMAFIFSGLFMVGRSGGIEGLLAAAAQQTPMRPFECGSAFRWNGGAVSDAPAQLPITQVATFKRQNEVESCFGELTGQLPASARLQTLGDSLLLTISGEDPSTTSASIDHWFTALEARTPTVFVASSNSGASLSISAELPTETEATHLEDELREYFSLRSSDSLIPPWYPNDQRTPEERANHRLARKTYLRAQETWGKNRDDQELRNLSTRQSEARRRGKGAEVNALQEQIEKVLSRRRAEELEKLKQGSDGAVDAPLVDLFASLTSPAAVTNTTIYEAVMADMADRMGRLPGAGEEVSRASQRYSTTTGWPLRTGRVVRLNWLSFVRIEDGAPALLDWLCSKPGAKIQYSLTIPAHQTSEEE